MKTVIICEDMTNDESWVTRDVENVCDYLIEYFGETLPASARIYHEVFAETNDVTPHSEGEIARLLSLEGTFFVVLYPEGPVAILAIVAIALAAVAIGLSFLLRPSMKVTPESSPNNDLSDRQNRARPNERIPDIVGTVRSTPDLIAVPYKLFFNNLQYEVCHLCIGRGSYTIQDCMDGTTPTDWIDGEFVAVYSPNTSANGAAGAESTPASTYGTNPLSSIPQVKSLQQSNSINGQVLRAPNVGYLNTNNNVAFAYPGSILTNGNDGLDFTDFYVASTVALPQYLDIYANNDGINASDPGERVHSVGITGRYQIVSVTATEVVLSAPGGGDCSTVDNDWNTINTFTGAQSTFYHSFQIIGEGDQWVGPYILNIADLSEVWCNFISPGGLYYVDDNGNQHAYIYTVQIGVQPIDASGADVGTETLATINLYGSSKERRDVGSTLTFYESTIGPVKVRARLLTNKSTDRRNQYNDQIQWRDMYGVSAISQTNFGNVTTLVAITAQTPAATSVRERKINMLVTRNIPTWINRDVFSYRTGTEATFGALQPSNNAADILCFLALDPYIGRRDVSELNVPAIYAAADAAFYDSTARHDGQIATAFGTFLPTEFCYTFDDSKQSFEEALAQLAQSINCIAYRRGSLISLFFEQQTANSTLLFNHRNKLPGSETRTITFGTITDNDGIEYDFVDPNAPNLPNVDTTRTLYFPVDQSAKNPKKITSIGVRNLTQATLNCWRLYQKLIHQNTQSQFDATQEADLLVLYNRILVADNTRSDTQDGEIVSQNGTIVTTSQPLTFDPAQTYTGFFQLADGTVEAIAVTPGAMPNTMILASAPSIQFVTDPSQFARTTYQIVGSAPTRSNAFLLAEKDPNEDGTLKLTAINYDDAYYAHDTDVINGALVPVNYGYQTWGYTGGGDLTSSGGSGGLPPVITGLGLFSRPALALTSRSTDPVIDPVSTFNNPDQGGSPAKTVTSSSQVTPTDGTVRVDASAAAVTVTLPLDALDGQWYYIKKIDSSANAVTVDGNGNQIDGTSTKSITAQYAALRLQFDAASSTWGIY